MDLTKYKCMRTRDSYRTCLETHMGCKEYINNFKRVQNKYNFDLSNYSGPLPLCIISSDKQYVYGYTKDTLACSIYDLEPHKSSPPEQYLWCGIKPSCRMSYLDIIYRLNHRCVQLVSPPPELNTTVQFFEESRYIMWLCVLETKCIPMEKLVDMEVEYMKQITTGTPSILKKCKELYNLRCASEEYMEKWIRKIYMEGKTDGSSNGLFDGVASEVKEMLM